MYKRQLVYSRKTVSVSEHEWHDNYVGDDRWQGVYKLLLSKEVSAECAEQCSDASEDDIPDDATCDKVGNQTSDKKPRNGCRCENRKDAKRFRKAYLNGA